MKSLRILGAAALASGLAAGTAQAEAIYQDIPPRAEFYTSGVESFVAWPGGADTACNGRLFFNYGGMGYGHPTGKKQNPTAAQRESQRLNGTRIFEAAVLASWSGATITVEFYVLQFHGSNTRVCEVSSIQIRG